MHSSSTSHWRHVTENKNGNFIFDQIGSDLSKMDQNGSNFIELDFSPGRTRPFLSPRHGSGHRGHRHHRSETVKKLQNN